jgi:hypothetical protein
MLEYPGLIIATPSIGYPLYNAFDYLRALDTGGGVVYLLNEVRPGK